MSDKYRRTLLNDAEKIEITWRFDEQQADPIHRNNFVENLKKELQQSLETGQVDAVVSVPEIRNKLSPVSNLIAMIDDVNVTVTFSSREYGEMFDTEIEEVKKAVRDLTH